MSLDVRCRPIDRWDGPVTDRRRIAPYSASWPRILNDLLSELEHLDARDVTLGIGLRTDQNRVDGWPKANASVPPPVSLTFDSRVGPTRMECDRWAHWIDNVRAIGLTLQRLRLVDEGGVARSGEQYQGWQALPPGTPMPAAQMTVEDAAELLSAYSIESPLSGRPCWTPREVLDGAAQAAWRVAAKRHHPDHGGDPDLFRRLTEARDLLLDEQER